MGVVTRQQPTRRKRSCGNSIRHPSRTAGVNRFFAQNGSVLRPTLNTLFHRFPSTFTGQIRRKSRAISGDLARSLAAAAHERFTR